MKITKNWINEFIDLSHISTKEICTTLNSIGLEVDNVQKVYIPDDVVVGLVKECFKHPDADKLNVCQVELENETVQIVCGAKNVRIGQFVPVAIVGCDLGNDFKIKRAKLRGVDSNGMICSSTELGLPKMNDGILELDNSFGNLKLGKNLNEYPLLNDDIIEIELTANRGDCWCIKGIAQDLCAFYDSTPIKQDLAIIENQEAIGRVLNVINTSENDSNLLYRVANTNELKVPLLLKIRAASVEIEKDTDIELMVAYATHSTGVLLNIYSELTDKKSGKIQLSIKKDENDFTHIVGKDKLSIVGVETCKVAKIFDNIVIEANYTDPSSLAQNVFNTKQKTGDVYYKSSRGSNPDLQYGMDYLCHLLSSNHSTINKGQIDYIKELENRFIDVNIERVNSIIGQNINKQKIENILTSLGFTTPNSMHSIMSKVIPATRHDIVNIADVTEEIVRIIGIDNIKAQPLVMEELNNRNLISQKLSKKYKLRSAAIANSFYETLTYVFASKELLSKYDFETVSPKMDILNPINNDLNTFRTTLLLNLILAVSSNEKQGFKSISLFELGVIFNEQRKESFKMAFVQSDLQEEESLENKAKPKKVDLFSFAQNISNCIGEFELETAIEINDKFLHPYQCANIIQNGKNIGIISKIHPNVANDFGISSDTFVSQIDFDLLNDDLIKATNISKYQNSKKDLSIVAPKDLAYKEIKKVINELNIDELKQFNLIDIYTDEELGDKESLTIKFVLQSNEKTLEDEDIVSIMNNIQDALKNKLDLELR